MSLTKDQLALVVREINWIIRHGHKGSGRLEIEIRNGRIVQVYPAPRVFVPGRKLDQDEIEKGPE